MPTAGKGGFVWTALGRFNQMPAGPEQSERPALEELSQLPGDPVVYDARAATVARVTAALGKRDNNNELKRVIDLAVQAILAGMRHAPQCSPVLVDMLVSLADCVSQDADGILVCPRLFLILGKHWAAQGELSAAKYIMDVVRRVLDITLTLAPTTDGEIATDLALFYLALSDVFETARLFPPNAVDEDEYVIDPARFASKSLSFAKLAWIEIQRQRAEPAYQVLVMRRYRRLLERQGHSIDVVKEAKNMEAELEALAGPLNAWILREWDTADV
jgi:hypothetical protein